MKSLNSKLIPLTALTALPLLLTACSTVPTTGTPPSCDTPPGPREIGEDIAAGVQKPLDRVRVSAAFNKHWRDGKAELSGYSVTTMRYGKPRTGNAVLVYVAEPMDSRTWIKDDSASRGQRTEVLKLNHTLNFRTGIYPYSVMTSVFTPLDGQGRERFAPAKISLTAQEWCGHVFQQIYPKGTRFHNMGHSYFAGEGDRRETVRTRALALYEDALWIQLRELDGPFAGGGDWSGDLVPSLWTARKRHRPLRPVAATIRRTKTERDGTPVTRFTVASGGVTRTFDVERAFPRRILGWRTSEGERAELLKTARLTYWMLNAPGDESYLAQLGLKP
jgi:hypothetical protein